MRRQNPLIKPASNDPHSNNKLCSEFAPRKQEYSAIKQNGNTISELTPNNSHSKIKIENANSLFALNHITDQLDKEFKKFQRIANSFNNVLMMSHSDEETLTQLKHSTPSKVRFANEAGPSTAPSVPATTSTPKTDTTTVTSPSTDDLHTDAFNFAFSEMFSSTLMASLTSKDAILKEIRDPVLTDNEDRCRRTSPYIQSFWKNLHVKNGCVCTDDRIAIPNSIKDAYVEAIHAISSEFGMVDMATHVWWPYMHRDIITKTAKCKPYVQIGKKSNYIIPSSKWAPLKLCKVPNEEIQFDFVGNIYNEKNQEVYFLAGIDRFSKFPTAESFDKANAENNLKLFQENFLLHGIHRTIRLDQAQCHIGHQIKAFCNQNNIQLIEAPIYDHRAIGLVERLTQTIKNRLACIKAAARNHFNLKASINSVIYRLRMCAKRPLIFHRLKRILVEKQILH